MITKYEDFCAICGTTENVRTHHCVFGRGLRELADADKLTLPCCDNCHNMGRNSIHGNSVSEKLSKIIGQLAWEKHYIAENASLPFEDMEEEAREAFRKRYSRSYL